MDSADALFCEVMRRIVWLGENPTEDPDTIEAYRAEANGLLLSGLDLVE